jgi:uncharacterized protein YggE
MRVVRIGVAVAALLAVAAFAGIGSPEPALSQAEEVQNGITATGMGSVRTVPDRAEFAFGVQTTGRTATQALAANATEMRRVIAALREAGVAAAEIQTQYVSLSPRQSDDGEIIGYTASNTVSARIRDLDRAGAVIDAAVSAGANQVSGPALSRSDATALYRDALRAAYNDARAKAQTLAGAAGVSLGRMLVVVEAGGGPAPIPAERTADTGTPIEPGTQEVSATVTVTFASS